MSLDSDAADQRGTQQENQTEPIRLASLDLSTADFRAFNLPTQNINQQSNMFRGSNMFSGFNPFDRSSAPYQNQTQIQFDGFNPPNRNVRLGYQTDQMQNYWQQNQFQQNQFQQNQFQQNPWQQRNQFRPSQMDASYAPNNFSPNQQGDFWGNYWSNYFREADRRGYRPMPQDLPSNRRPRYEPTERPNPNVRPNDQTSSRMPLEPVDPTIANDISKRRNGERVDPVYVGIDNRESYKGPDGKKHIRNAPAWLDRPAAQAFLMINEELASLGKKLMPASHCADCANINSLGRTNTQQAIASGIHAAVGNSEHERGAAMDVKNFEDPDVSRLLKKYGFVQGNLSRPGVPIPGDAHHFSFSINNAPRIAQMWEQSPAKARFATTRDPDSRQTNYRPDNRADFQPDDQSQIRPRRNRYVDNQDS